MLMPKRTKYRKQFRGRMKGKAHRGATVSFGEYGLQTLEPSWISSRQIEACRRAIVRHMKRRKPKAHFHQSPAKLAPWFGYQEVYYSTLRLALDTAAFKGQLILVVECDAAAPQEHVDCHRVAPCQRSWLV